MHKAYCYLGTQAFPCDTARSLTRDAALAILVRMRDPFACDAPYRCTDCSCYDCG